MKRKRGRRAYTIMNFKVNHEGVKNLSIVTDDYTSEYCKVSPDVSSERKGWMKDNGALNCEEKRDKRERNQATRFKTVTVI
ncbi:hypothetical protein LXL04_015665 [Taraxacum kok-saghyz]